MDPVCQEVFQKKSEFFYIFLKPLKPLQNNVKYVSIVPKSHKNM